MLLLQRARAIFIYIEQNHFVSFFQLHPGFDYSVSDIAINLLNQIDVSMSLNLTTTI